MKRIFFIILISFLAVAIGSIFYFRWQINSPAGKSEEKAEVKIADGQSSWQVANDLKKNDLISNKVVFRVYLKIYKKTLKSGDYLITKNLSIIQVAEILNNRGHQVIKITIPEGWRKEQIAVYLSKNAGISSDDFLSLAKNSEGKLFPDTYFLTDEPTAEEVFEKMTENYQNRISGLSVDDEILAVASIVEHEAAGDADRATIAGVFYNRLKIGMKLESDVTSQYQKDTNNFAKVGVLNYKFWQPLSSGETRKIVGPFNTYQISGLPPAPICNPGLASIKATLSPENHNYYYFLYGKDGILRLATDKAGHDENIGKYL
ncbi:MAG: UPF0755 protein [Candidatus Berkelbacteria bacterium Athens1014_28]|uniref:Endolytic murein transglycosylase n=1 Tax=Candidatus Berkelbacteria bacterium Athens1014_28 TaxID=2017145 RepID=A0A554LP13_9BACT|nr:MAG: UPF0755 protein [Candidatus Berkelbacteria bacterium Athens1014_28]